MTPLANNLEVKTINHLGIIAGIIDEIQNNTGVKNQLGKLTDQPTRPWIFQGFQGIHVVVLNGVKQIVNLTDSRLETLNYFSQFCQKYYILSG